MMRTVVRSIAVLAFAAGLVVACSAAATSTPAATPAPAPAAATTTPAPADPTGTPVATPTGPPVATPTAAPSVGPMDPAYVTGTGTLSQANPGTTTPDGDCTRIDGVVVESTGTNTDPRAAGAARVTVSAIDCGGVGFQWGRMVQTTADGAWEGTCTGAMWASESESSLSCWLVGSGAYKGLTYNMHSRNVDLSVVVDGVILPAAPPTAP